MHDRMPVSPGASDPTDGRSGRGRALDDDALARRAAIRNLSILDARLAPVVDDALALLALATDAVATGLTVVTDTTTVTIAGSIGRREVALERSPAARAVAGDARLAVEVGADDELADHPSIGAQTLPVTVVAVPVRVTGAATVVALELVWSSARTPDASLLAAIDRVASHLGRVLALHAETDEYRRFVEIAPDPIVLLDDAGMIERVNGSFAAMVGHHRVELMGRSFVALVARDERAAFTAALARVTFARHRPGHLDVTLVTTAGDRVPCSVSAAHLGGPRRAIQLVIHDLSERLRAEEEQIQLSEQLARAQRLDAVGQVAAGLAHDLNNLLMIMVSNLGLAEESVTSAVDGDADALVALGEDLAELRAAVDRATALTRSLLSFGTRRGGEGSSADVSEVLDAVGRFVEPSLGESITLRLIVPAQLPQIDADPVELERAVLNLVINARDALGGDGTITVAAELLGSADQVGRRADDPDPVESVRIRVVDDGTGMDAGTLARAFEPLFTTKGESGSGLGLASVSAFVDHVSGTIDVSSVPGDGTEVVLTIPIAAASTQELPVGVDVPVGGARVLLVDPGERTRRVIARMLRSSGYRVVEAASADEARQALGREPIGLMVTELALPDGSGDRLVRSVRDDHPEVVAIVLAAVDGPRTLDGVPVLVKPFSATRLLRTVNRVLAAR
jgi:PAS domain S-box-containing protein